jgi:hypothetical protein
MERVTRIKRAIPSWMSSSEISKPSNKRPAHTNITLNYGVEIEAVFELINEHIAYNQLIYYYIHNKENSIETIKKFIQIIITCIKNPESQSKDIQAEINILKENEIYKFLSPKLEINEYTFLDKLGVDDNSELANNYIKTGLETLFNSSINKPFNQTDIDLDEETKNNIQNWSNFVNIGIIVIKYMLEKLGSPYTIDDVITVLNIPMEFEKGLFNAFTNFFNFKLNKKIKLYKLINNFSFEEQEDNEISLCLIPDVTVICDNRKIYKNISSGEIIKYYKLLNHCEFITKPFKTIDNIANLGIFLNDPIIKDTLLNCANTSQHVHISFNKNDSIIKPDIHLVLSIICVCYLFQEEIFKLFLITRSDNMYCKKLNYNKDKILKNPTYYNRIYTFDNIMEHAYNENIITILMLFYTEDDFDEDKICENRYFWLNILNLYPTGFDKPYTIEFRLKHGSNDIEELHNTCKLYENIINYATELLKENESTLRTKLNIIDFITEIEKLININKVNIFNEKILKDIYWYFTSSAYKQGLDKLNQLILRQPATTAASGVLFGGKAQKRQIIIDEFIEKLAKKEIYRYNSFGIEFIGIGLAEYIKKNLQATFLNNDTSIDDKNLKLYLETYNIYYDIKYKRVNKSRKVA